MSIQKPSHAVKNEWQDYAVIKLFFFFRSGRLPTCLPSNHVKSPLPYYFLYSVCVCIHIHTHTSTHTHRNILLPLIIMKELSTHYPRNKRRKISLHIPTSRSPLRPKDKLQHVFFTMLESRVEKAFNTIHWKNKMGFPGRSADKEYTCNSGDSSAIPGSGRSSGEWIGCPLQYSCASLVAQLVKNLQFGRPGFDPWA